MTSAILLSGGVDSIAVAFWKRPRAAITIDYGQVCAEAELEAASQVCTALSLHQEIIRVDCRSLGSGDLAGRPSMPNTPTSEWWPYRNQLLITLGGMRAISIGVSELLMGSVSSDSIHSDGRAAFYDAIHRLMRDQEGGLIVAAPALRMTTLELVKASKVPRYILSWAHSCHRSNVACGNCRGCNKREGVMEELGWG